VENAFPHVEKPNVQEDEEIAFPWLRTWGRGGPQVRSLASAWSRRAHSSRVFSRACSIRGWLQTLLPGTSYWGVKAYPLIPQEWNGDCMWHACASRMP